MRTFYCASNKRGYINEREAEKALEKGTLHILYGRKDGRNPAIGVWVGKPKDTRGKTWSMWEETWTVPVRSISEIDDFINPDYIPLSALERS